MRPRILFYNDSPIIGGHEMMTMLIANQVARSIQCDILFLHAHVDVPAMLEGNIKTQLLPFHAKSLWPFLGASMQTHVRFIKECIRSFSPSVCVISQGYIESGVRGIMAACAAGVRTVSYIPFGYSNREINSRGAYLRDLVSRFIFNAPDEFITISEAQKTLLSRFIGSDVPVHVIPNLVDLDSAVEAVTTRESIGGGMQIGVIGRINFQQKNQNVCIAVAQQLLATNRAFHFHIVGDGPDRKSFEKQIVGADLQQYFTFHGWLNKADFPVFIQNNLDLLLIPSWYEGVPLILLEALHMGVPFLISNRHFIKDYCLPDQYLIDPASAEDIAERIIKYPELFDAAELESVRNRVLPMHSRKNFEDSVKSVFELISGEGAAQ